MGETKSATKKPLKRGRKKGQKDRPQDVIDASVKQRDPHTEREFAFCEHYLRSHDQNQAAKAAGYVSYYSNGPRLRRQFAAYLAKRSLKVEKQIAKAIAYDQQDLLNEMASIAFANPQDYIIKVLALVGDQQVQIDALRPIETLTRAQAAAIKKVAVVNGVATYELPDLTDKYQYLFALGKNLGLYHDKLIQEFRHQHLHAHVDFKDLPADKLQTLERLLVDAIGPDARRLLGIQPEPREEHETASQT